MSNALPIRELVMDLVAAINQAWEPATISVGKPREQQALPYVTLMFRNVEISMSGPGSTVLGTSQKHLFEIIGRFAFPADPTQEAELLKVDRANELIAILQTGPNFGSGILPLVSTVDFQESDEPYEGAYEVMLSFEVTTIATHH